MKKVLVFLAIMAGMLIAACVKKPVEMQSKVEDLRTETRIEKAGYMDNFARGSANLQQSHIQATYQIVAYLEQHPKTTLFLKGSVSTERIAGGRCYVTDDYSYFSMSRPKTGARKITNEAECEEALGTARVAVVKGAIVGQGIQPGRIHTFVEVDQGRRGGQHDLNRAVSYWYLEAPEGTTVVDVHEDSDGDLVLVVEKPTPPPPPPPTFLEKMKLKKRSKPPPKEVRTTG